MPASKKTLANNQKAKNIAAGIGDADGRLPARVKAAEVVANCTICSTSIRMTKKNVEAKSHSDSKHPTSTFEICFPGFKFIDESSSAVVDYATGAAATGPKIDVDLIKKQAREAKTLAEGGMTDAQKAALKAKKKKDDLSFLDAALGPVSGKKK